ncbi:MAG: aspartate-semialdehyde dehydrogenase [Polyangiaceae bacterium]|nr:aspartate-semialdehyde dehydrogenase [Polyangiaceae bacterium]
MRVGFVGWRGMVGSVLLDRMQAEGDFRRLDEAEFFTTSHVGAAAPTVGIDAPPLKDAFDLGALGTHDVVVTCQGGDYTSEVHPKLRAAGWRGYWIDAASTLRMAPEATIILDPVNRAVIDRALVQGVKDFIGGNCTVSLMLMAFAGLYHRQWVEWVSTMTYQAASGAGAKNMRELLDQMRVIGEGASELLADPAADALMLDRNVAATLASGRYPTAQFGAPLAASLIPWIDRQLPSGETREEWKGHVESNKILGNDPEIPVDGLCVRIGAMRSHSQAVTIKLRREVPLPEVEQAIADSTPWTRLVPNEKAATLARLTPAAVSGTLDVAVGRLRTLRMGPEYLGAFTVGDQLLWGAAEPVRRMLRILLDRQ